MAAYSYKGVEYEFVNTQIELLEELKCPICLELVSDPVQTSCGHLFCGKCIKGTNTCPIDRSQFTSHADNFNHRRVRNFKVKCPKKGIGCQWQGVLGDVEEHSNTGCGYVTVVCTNNGCGLEVVRKELDTHKRKVCSQRLYMCPYCFQRDTHQEIVTTHFTTCPEMPLLCPGGCGSGMLMRRNMAEHLSEKCPEELVQCRYAIAGCEEAVKRKDLDEHLHDKPQHFDALMESYTSLSLLVRDMLAKVNSGNQQKVEATHLPLPFRPWLQNTPTCYPRPPWIIKMDELREKKDNNLWSILQVTNEEGWFSDPVHSHFGGYKMCLRVDANGHKEGKGTHVSVYVYLMRGDNDDNLKWPFKGTIKVSLLNQLENGQHHTKQVWSHGSDIPESYSKRVREGERADIGWGLDQFISYADLGYRSEKNCQYLKDNKFFFRVDCFEPKLD